MLLSEMVRKIRYEKHILSDSNYYTQNAVTDWVTVKSVTVELPTTCLLYIQFKTKLVVTASPWTTGGAGRCLINGIPVISSGELYHNQNTTATITVGRSLYIVLPAGSRTIEFQVSVFTIGNTSNNVGVGEFLIKQLCFSDMTNLFKNSEYINVPNGQTRTIINENILFPARRTCAGTIKQMQLFIYVYAEGENFRISRMKNPGEANDSCLNWRLFINGVPTAWSDRRGDFDSGATTNQSYAEGAYGYYTALITADQTINVKIEAYNGGSGRNVRAIVVVFACPWIIPSTEYEPLGLNFPQGSTLYLVLEPLSSDPTKTIKLGYIRAWDLGYNYYSMASGVGVLYWNYTFESVEVGQCVLLVGGNGGCISIIALDVRA